MIRVRLLEFWTYYYLEYRKYHQYYLSGLEWTECQLGIAYHVKIYCWHVLYLYLNSIEFPLSFTIISHLYYTIQLPRYTTAGILCRLYLLMHTLYCNWDTIIIIVGDIADDDVIWCVDIVVRITLIISIPILVRTGEFPLRFCKYHRHHIIIQGDNWGLTWELQYDLSAWGLLAIYLIWHYHQTHNY